MQKAIEQQEEKIPQQQASYASLRGKCGEKSEGRERGLKLEKNE